LIKKTVPHTKRSKLRGQTNGGTKGKLRKPSSTRPGESRGPQEEKFRTTRSVHDPPRGQVGGSNL